MKELTMVRGAKILVDTCANLKTGENVAIVTDMNNITIAKVLSSLVIERGAEPILFIMTPRQNPSEEPPRSISNALTYVDVVFAPTTSSLTRTDAKVKACKAGARFISMPDYSEEMLIQGAIFEDFLGQKEVADQVGNLFTAAREARIYSALGTNLKLRLGDRQGNVESGVCHDPGSSSSPPNIETNVSPIEGTAEGVIVVDGSITFPEIRKVSTPIELTIVEGKITKIVGQNQAEELSKILKSFDDPNVYALAELGFGMNRKAKIIGRMLEDEGTYGAVHFGFGDNHTTGGKITSKIHFDVILRNVTVELDDQVVMKDKELIFC